MAEDEVEVVAAADGSLLDLFGSPESILGQTENQKDKNETHEMRRRQKREEEREEYDQE